jgi:integrase
MATLHKRLTSKGKTRWHVRVRIKGYPTQTKTFTNKLDAEYWANKTQNDLIDGKTPNTITQKSITVEFVINEYINEWLPVKQSRKNNKELIRQLNWWKHELGDVALLKLEPTMLRKAKKSLLKGRQPSTVNRYLAALSGCFNYCVKETDYGLTKNPFSEVSRYSESHGRDRVLDDYQRCELLNACADIHNELHTIVVLALTTGMRMSEILRIKWINIDFTRGLIKIVETKNNETRSAALVGTAFDLLQSRHKSSKTAHVFSEIKTRHQLHKWFRQAVDIAEIEDFRFHDLRHCAATYLAQSGATLTELAEALGHKTLAMVSRYSHLTEGHNKPLVEKMARSIGL